MLVRFQPGAYNFLKRGDFAVLAGLALLLLAQFSPILFTSRTYFLSDLTYYYHPWRVLPAELLQRGMLPLWNPYAYMGMPLLGIFQTGTFAPGTLPFLLSPFVSAYKIHLLIHHGLAAFFAYLWLRRFSGRWGCAAGAAAFSLGGFLLSHVGQLNVTGTFFIWPALFLFSNRPPLLALALAISLLAGYPQAWAQMLLAALLLPWARGGSWGRSILLALGLSAPMILPGLEMISLSNRSSGVHAQERLVHSVSPGHLAGFISPAFAEPSEGYAMKYPPLTTFHIGFAAFFLICLGIPSLTRARTARLGCFLAGTVLLMLGAHCPLSAWLWTYFWPLKYIRYPASFACLLLPAAMPVLALALRGRRWGAWACLAVCLELLAYGRGLEPTMPDDYFSDKGPLAAQLQGNLDGHRYALSPQAAFKLQGWGNSEEERYLDLKRRLYASTNVPYHLPAATSTGESLLPASNDGVINFIFSLSGAKEAARYLPWLDARALIYPGPVPEKGWAVLDVPGAARARWVSEEDRALLEGDLRGAPKISARNIAYQESREDRYRVTGTAPSAGWVVVSNPLYPGWEAYSEGKRLEVLPALGAFERVAVSPGPLKLDFIYRPASFYLGVLIFLASLGLLCRPAIKLWY